MYNKYKNKDIFKKTFLSKDIFSLQIGKLLNSYLKVLSARYIITKNWLKSQLYSLMRNHQVKEV